MMNSIRDMIRRCAVLLAAVLCLCTVSSACADSADSQVIRVVLQQLPGLNSVILEEDLPQLQVSVAGRDEDAGTITYLLCFRDYFMARVYVTIDTEQQVVGYSQMSQFVQFMYGLHHAPVSPEQAEELAAQAFDVMIAQHTNDPRYQAYIDRFGLTAITRQEMGFLASPYMDTRSEPHVMCYTVSAMPLHENRDIFGADMNDWHIEWGYFRVKGSDSSVTYENSSALFQDHREYITDDLIDSVYRAARGEEADRSGLQDACICFCLSNWPMEHWFPDIPADQFTWLVCSGSILADIERFESFGPNAPIDGFISTNYDLMFTLQHLFSQDDACRYGLERDPQTYARIMAFSRQIPADRLNSFGITLPPQ